MAAPYIDILFDIETDGRFKLEYVKNVIKPISQFSTSHFLEINYNLLIVWCVHISINKFRVCMSVLCGPDEQDNATYTKIDSTKLCGYHHETSGSQSLLTIDTLCVGRPLNNIDFLIRKFNSSLHLD